MCQEFMRSSAKDLKRHQTRLRRRVNQEVRQTTGFIVTETSNDANLHASCSCRARDLPPSSRRRGVEHSWPPWDSITSERDPSASVACRSSSSARGPPPVLGKSVLRRQRSQPGGSRSQPSRRETRWTGGSNRRSADDRFASPSLPLTAPYSRTSARRCPAVLCPSACSISSRRLRRIQCRRRLTTRRRLESSRILCRPLSSSVDYLKIFSATLTGKLLRSKNI